MFAWGAVGVVESSDVPSSQDTSGSCFCSRRFYRGHLGAWDPFYFRDLISRSGSLLNFADTYSFIPSIFSKKGMNPEPLAASWDIRVVSRSKHRRALEQGWEPCFPAARQGCQLATAVTETFWVLLTVRSFVLSQRPWPASVINGRLLPTQLANESRSHL